MMPQVSGLPRSAWRGDGVLEKLDRRLTALDAALGRAADPRHPGRGQGALQIRELRSQKAAPTEQRNATVAAVPALALHPAIADAYPASLGGLEHALKGPEGPLEVDQFSAIRDLVEAITVTPKESSATPQIEGTDDLARLLAPSGTSSGGKDGSGGGI